MDSRSICPKCGTALPSDAAICESCALQSQITTPPKAPEISEKSARVAALLCIGLGNLGMHRFYVGKIFSGTLMFFTLGAFGIATGIDFYNIINGLFTDKFNKRLEFKQTVKTSILSKILTSLILMFSFLVTSPLGLLILYFFDLSHLNPF